MTFLFPSRLIITLVRFIIRYFHLNQRLLDYAHPAGAPQKKLNPQGTPIPMLSRGIYPQGAQKPCPDQLKAMQETHWINEQYVLLHHSTGQIECFIQPGKQKGNKVWIAFSGNGQCFKQPHNHQEALAQIRLQDEQEHLENTTIILVNHPGVGHSAYYGRARQSIDDLYHSAWVATQFFLQHYHPSNVTIFGHSLGGVVASWVAYHCHSHQQDVYLVVSRSLASSSNFLYAHLPKLMFFFCWLIVPLGYLTHTHINAAKYYYGIPKTYRFAYETVKDELMKPKACLSHHWRRSKQDHSVARLEDPDIITQNSLNPCQSFHNGTIDLHHLWHLFNKES